MGADELGNFWEEYCVVYCSLFYFSVEKEIIRFISAKTEWLVSLYTILFVFALSFYCLAHLPVLDFRPYKIGKNILQGMEIPDGAKPNVYETTFLMEKDGEKKSLHSRIIRIVPGHLWIHVLF